MTARRRFWSMIANRPAKIAASRIVIPHSNQQSESTSAPSRWEWLQSMPESNLCVTFPTAPSRAESNKKEAADRVSEARLFATLGSNSHIQANGMAYENTVLSLNSDRQSLLSHESALQKSGFEIVSVSSPLQARFEIEMGRCGVFITSYITPLVIFLDLASLFRRSCPGGLVAYVARHPDENISDTDILLSDCDNPDSIVDKIRKQSTKSSG